jgi:flagellar protein FliO/FliZ
MTKVFRYLCLFILIAPCFLLAQEEPKPNTPHKEFEIPNPFPELKELPPQPERQFMGEFINMLVILALIVVFMYVASYFLKRFLQSKVQLANVDSSIKILEQRTLSQKATIYLLDVEGTRLLIADSHAGVFRLAELPEEGKRMKEEMPFPKNP